MPPTAPAKRAPRAAPTRTNDPERTTANILEVATHAFADKGFDGARIDEIAEAMHTSKRMIYYYFGSKEALYLAVLEGAYQRMRAAEATLDLDALPPRPSRRWSGSRTTTSSRTPTSCGWWRTRTCCTGRS